MKKYYVLVALWVSLAVFQTILTAVNFHDYSGVYRFFGVVSATVSFMVGLRYMNVIHLMNIMDLMDEESAK